MVSEKVLGLKFRYRGREKKKKRGKSKRKFLYNQVVRTKGLEPPRLSTLDPKSSAATNYATCAGFMVQSY